MDAFQFIKDVPTDWHDTRVLNGEVGDYVTIARKDRNWRGWYLGSVTDEQARELDVPLSFLDPRALTSRRFYRDGDDADWKANPFAFARETREVTSTDTLARAARARWRAGDPVHAEGALSICRRRP
jgi:alpha-glucosidase